MIYIKNEDDNKEVLIIKDKDIGCVMHFHGRIELIYFISGEHDIKVGGNSFKLYGGDMFFCNSYEVHKLSEHNYGELILLSFSISDFNEIKKTSGDVWYENALTDKQSNRKIYEIMDELLQRFDTLNKVQKKAYVYMIMGTLESIYGFAPCKKNYNAVRDILLYVSDNFRNKIERDEVAHKFGFTPNYFSAFFKSKIGVGFVEYLNQIRLLAVEELLNTHKNITKTEAVMQSGFSNMQSYYRALEKQRNQPPI